MPDFGEPVAQYVDTSPAKGLKTLSDLLGLQKQRQELGTGQFIQQKAQGEAQQAQQAMQERQRIQTMMQSGRDDQGNDIRNANGEPDPAKILPALGRMAPLTGQQVAQSVLATHTAKVGLQAAATNLDAEQRQALAGPIQAIATDPTNEGAIGAASSAIDQWVQAHPEMAPNADYARTLLGMVQKAKTPQVRAHLAGSMSAMLQGGQQVQTQPQQNLMNTGGQTLSVVTPPPLSGGVPTITGSIDNTLSPTTPVFNPKTNQMEYVGKPPGATAPVAAGAPMGAEAGVASNVSDMNTHFSGLQTASQGASLISGLTGNVKALAQRAVTGTEADRQAYVNGLLNTLGVGDKASGNLQTDTDLLRKQLAQINTNTKASSDAQQALIQAAQPNSHMSAKAMSEAADQIASQVQLNMAIRNKLSSAKYANNGQGDSTGYQGLRQKIEEVADPRAIQWQNLGPGSPEAKAYVKGLTPKDQKDLRKSISGMRELGLL